MIDNRQTPHQPVVTPQHSQPAGTGPQPPTQQPAMQAPAVPQRPKQRKSDGWHSVVSTVLVLIIAPIIAIFLTMFVFQSYQVDGPSMETTLHNNDRLIVWKLARTWAKITHHTYIPKRGDVVVFTDGRLGQFGQDPDKQLIKRVVGLPGDKVVVSGGDVTVFNTAHPNGFDPDKTLPYGNVIPTTAIDGEWTIGNNQVFVMGDNRGNSLDSRLFGPVDASNIIGKLAVRVLPANTIKRF
ncbi:MAG TPA: signal peptidase I [Candidatus Saccharimonadales bacterium]|nr:signal peptidase I [Candidatus Saccharimonadales bacterium]